MGQHRGADEVFTGWRNARNRAERPGLVHRNGIISDVEAIKERVPAPNRVEKGGGIGHSRHFV